MATRILNVEPGIPSFDMRATLDGREYVLVFDWNQRESKWYLSLLDDAENPVAEGLKLVSDFPVNRRLTDARAPRGMLFVWDSTDEGTDPGLETLGDSHLLLYVDAADVVAFYEN